MDRHLIPKPAVFEPVAFPPDFFSRLQASMEAACRWITGVAQVRTDDLLCGEDPREMLYDSWRGAIRGEYQAATGKWAFYCPYWHSAQAAKALLAAARHGGDGSYLAGAEAVGEFLLRHRVTDRANPDFGLPFAYEDSPHTVNTSAILESIDGLLSLADATGNPRYEEAAIEALEWVARTAYLPERGLFDNSYDPQRRAMVLLRAFSFFPEERRARPLLDDAAFLKGFYRTGAPRFREIFLATAETLLETEEPQGNWIRYSPCHKEEGRIHPRHAYWWGGPMIDAWKETGDPRFREAALRSIRWYARALRRDGGFIRNTGPDFNTDSFGHATSGSACAAILFLRAALELGELEFLPLASRALEYCMKMQFREPEDPNLRGAILEKILPPNGTDRSPFYLRDLGTIFFVQAAALCLSIRAGETARMPEASLNISIA